ncbi:alpha/beta hydrolase-fold protein [Erwinia sp. INIA-01]|uniref:alpha/beta hydrolase n=1 Tax=Erwinia sp. INIA01 TaxID=2991500 RepID=UPI0022256067|nr:alpha/beta hydrolase-fold protein [Erwinia sp. INIA01]MCW1877707.1 alpha/beta hydrolase-fold protein [Erwinia sp. INIA01]
MSHRPDHRQICRVIARLGVFTIMLLGAGNSFARPNLTPLGPNIADRGSAYYHFTVRQFDSADGRRHYKVWTAIPDKAPPASGYPLLYLLDGNAAMDKLSDDLLRQLSAVTPPVLVAVGYQTDLPFDQLARAYDYTPAHWRDRQNRGGREGGGSSAFRQLLTQTIAPQVEKGLPIDAQRRGLWGHSYGGLLVLDSFLSAPSFNDYFAASPSVAQDDFVLLKRLGAVTKDEAKGRRLHLLEGDGDLPRPGEEHRPDALAAVRVAVAELSDNGVGVTWQLFPGLRHGEMFPASLRSALLQMAEVQ